MVLCLYLAIATKQDNLDIHISDVNYAKGLAAARAATGGQLGHFAHEPKRTPCSDTFATTKGPFPPGPYILYVALAIASWLVVNIIIMCCLLVSQLAI